MIQFTQANNVWALWLQCIHAFKGKRLLIVNKSHENTKTYIMLILHYPVCGTEPPCTAVPTEDPNKTGHKYIFYYFKKG